MMKSTEMRSWGVLSLTLLISTLMADSASAQNRLRVTNYSSHSVAYVYTGPNNVEIARTLPAGFSEHVIDAYVSGFRTTRLPDGVEEFKDPDLTVQEAR